MEKLFIRRAKFQRFIWFAVYKSRDKFSTLSSSFLTVEYNYIIINKEINDIKRTVCLQSFCSLNELLYYRFIIYYCIIEIMNIMSTRVYRKKR